MRRVLDANCFLNPLPEEYLRSCANNFALAEDEPAEKALQNELPALESCLPPLLSSSHHGACHRAGCHP